MKPINESIRKIVNRLNDENADGGGFWLPNIQRSFVWKEEQIEKLFDSIMRQYPISTLLAWKTKQSMLSRRFIDNYNCLLYTSPSPRDLSTSRMPSSA